MKFRIQNDELRIVSRGTFTAGSSCFARTVFDRAVRSARLSESQTVREDAKTGFDSAMRVPVPNARLKCRRSPRNLFRAWVQLYKQRSREDVGCKIEFRFRNELYSYAIRPRDPREGPSA